MIKKAERHLIRLVKSWLKTGLVNKEVYSHIKKDVDTFIKIENEKH